MNELLEQAITNLDNAIDLIEGNLSDSPVYQTLSNIIGELQFLIDNN